MKEMFKITGDKKHFTKPRRSINDNKLAFDSYFKDSDINMSMSMKPEYQNYQSRIEVDRKSS